MSRFDHTPDRTLVQRQSGVGMCTKLLFLCGHKGHSTGGLFRGYVPWRCAACNQGAKP